MTEPEKTPRIVRVITPDDLHASETAHARSASPAELLAGRVSDGGSEQLEVVVEYCEGPTGTREFTVDIGAGAPLTIPAEPPVEEFLLGRGVAWK
ncbi:hypothetical protein [Cryptosporangium sp. NPDC048952]|uniref:hypothetical protein n=1 Tax=Cryptosporangium sp. NPDC048952 TaxID=3363961 RepID=UPI00371E3ECD